MPGLWSFIAPLLVLLAASAASADMLDDYTSVGPVPRHARTVTIPGRRVMVIGDSIMAGTGLSKDQNQATYRLQRYGGIVIHNFASPGATMADIPPFLPGMDQSVPAVKLLSGFFGMYGLVIDLGANDWGQAGITPDAFDSAYGAFLDAIPAGLHVACMGFTWSTSEGVLNAHGKTRDDYRAIIKDVCTARSVPYLDGKTAIPNLPTFFVDGLHPNDKGNRAMGAFLVRQLHGLGWF
jgi:lysophospholipase L1-like esterase